MLLILALMLPSSKGNFMSDNEHDPLYSSVQFVVPWYVRISKRLTNKYMKRKIAKSIIEHVRKNRDQIKLPLTINVKLKAVGIEVYSSFSFTLQEDFSFTAEDLVPL